VKMDRSGFTLVEMAIVLVIVGLLLSGGMTILATQQEVRRVQETTDMLNEARDAVIGFAIANGRLPCPASTTSAGVESFCTNNTPVACGAATTIPQPHGRCTNFYNGFLPAVTLGISSVDSGGYAVDGWGTTQNRIRYSVTNYKDPVNLIFSFTATTGMRTTTMSTLSTLPPSSYLNVCNSATGISATTCGAALGNTLTSNAPVVVYSLGKNAATGGTGLDEAANLNADSVFISHSPVGAGGTNGEFDDLLVWLSPSILFNRLVAAGVLP